MGMPHRLEDRTSHLLRLGNGGARKRARKNDHEESLSVMSDDQLLEILQKKRDLKAFQILYDRMSPKIRAWIWNYSRRYRFTRSEEDDVYSDVTLRIAKSTRAYDPALGNASC
jgi:hypothetical protein